MITTGGKRKLWLGGWILAALFVLAYSASGFLALFSPPLIGYSHTVRSIIPKKLQLQALMSAAEKSDASMELSRLPAGLIRSAPTEEKQSETSLDLPPVPSQASKGATENVQTPTPPKLQGIFRMIDGRGTLVLRALLDGKLHVENDRIGDFTVKHISEKGVRLTLNFQDLFLPSPDVPFSPTREE